MNVIYLIILYAAICICMIIFNVIAIIHNKSNIKINLVKEKKYKIKIKEQLKKIETVNEVEKDHKKYIKRKLLSSNNLLTYESIISNYLKRKDENYDNLKKYLELMKPTFNELFYKYQKRNSIEKSYFIKVMTEYKLLKNNIIPAIDESLFENLNDESIYCRDNSYLAICSIENPNKINDALIIISNSEKFFHKNIITIGLNLYNGKSNELLNILVKNFNKYSDNIKCCIIEYAAYIDNNYGKYILELFLNKQTPRQIRISCLKYFEYVFYHPAGAILTASVYKYLDKDEELCYYIIKALKNYATKTAIKAIEKSIYSENFKIRDIACESLAFIRLGINAKEVDDFLNNESELLEMYDYYFQKNKTRSGEIK